MPLLSPDAPTCNFPRMVDMRGVVKHGVGGNLALACGGHGRQSWIGGRDAFWFLISSAKYWHCASHTSSGPDHVCSCHCMEIIGGDGATFHLLNMVDWFMPSSAASWTIVLVLARCHLWNNRVISFEKMLLLCSFPSMAASLRAFSALVIVSGILVVGLFFVFSAV